MSPFYVAQVTIVWVLGLLTMRYTATVYPLPSSVEAPATVTSDAPIDSAERSPEPVYGGERGQDRSQDWAVLGQQYLGSIRVKGWAHDPQLTQATLARHLGTNGAYLSRALNQGLGDVQ